MTDQVSHYWTVVSSYDQKYVSIDDDGLIVMSDTLRKATKFCDEKSAKQFIAFARYRNQYRSWEFIPKYIREVL